MSSKDYITTGVATAMNEIAKKDPWAIADKIFSRTIMALAGGSALANIMRNKSGEDFQGGGHRKRAFVTGFMKGAGVLGNIGASAGLLSLIPIAAGAVRAADKGDLGPGQVVDEILGIGRDTAQAAGELTDSVGDAARNFRDRLTSTARDWSNGDNVLARISQSDDESIGGVQ